MLFDRRHPSDPSDGILLLVDCWFVASLERDVYQYQELNVTSGSKQIKYILEGCQSFLGYVSCDTKTGPFLPLAWEISPYLPSITVPLSLSLFPLPIRKEGEERKSLQNT